MGQAYDLIVIGAGPGGYEAAVRSAQLGKKTALIEKKEIGGTCLNRGCIPTKALMHSCHILEEMRNAEELGIHADNITVNFAAMHNRKNQVVTQLREGIAQLIKANKIDFYHGTAYIKEQHTVEVMLNSGEKTDIEADKILIASGSVPALPPIKGADLPGVVTSDDILSEEGCDFKNLVIIGGGVIGIEIASVYRALGTDVTIIEAEKNILSNLEKELQRSIAMVIKKHGIKLHTTSMVKQIEKTDDALCVYYSEKGKEESILADGVLIATGRRACINGLFDENLGIETERGAIKTDADFMTSVKDIYAVGDVVYGNIQLAHTASAQGLYAVSKMFERDDNTDLRLIPSCIYISPEVASVGMSLEQAKESGISAEETKILMTSNGKSLISREDRSFIKIVYNTENHVMLGAVMMCARATDMISEFTLAISKGLTLEDMEAVVRPHPTYSEGITEAAESGLLGAIHGIPKKDKY